MPSPSASVPVKLRRDPLTGQYIPVPVNGARSTLAQRLQANALPLSTDVRYANPSDPLLQLQSAQQSDDAFWQVHAETLWNRPLAQRQQDQRAYFARTIGAVESLLERSDIVDITIVEHHRQGRVISCLYGFSDATTRSQVIQGEAQRWNRRTGGDLLADVLTSELVDGSRILLNTEHWIAYIPYASTAPLEILVMPKQTSRSLAALSDAARDNLAEVTHRLFSLLCQVAGAEASFTACWNMAPASACPHVSRLHLRVTADAPLESSSPEALAEQLRALS
ncbi:HIT domain-containing protein [Rothia nasimurium]|uniref:Galactose-1-phosphate uridylyltransferase n=2 Tax=Rothia nasimurium TaxID=85336 RepID=A0A4Y9F3G2_9MICC|nr:HIT domain-containing protein [Rothia nasimurium]MBF0808268.1 HIT domain-containing protein [Rothia nasimurium]TFU22332.1 HIT domain-containing protein [Rothia nasimurium]